MAFWDTWFGGGGSDQLQEVNVDYAGMHNASPTGYNALQSQRAGATDTLQNIMPNYGGMQAASPTGWAGRQAGQPSDLGEQLGAAAAMMPQQDPVQSMFQARGGSAPTGLLDFYQNSMASQFKPVQSQQGLMTMPTYNFAGAK